MNSPVNYYDQLLSAAGEDALMLTANKRLARHLRGLYDERMRSAGHRAWPSPSFFSADDWQARSLSTLEEGWRLLSTGVAQRLWEEVIDADTAATGYGLLQVAASARRAREAHELLLAYQADISAWPLTDDHRAFIRWRQGFQDACRSNGWLDPATNSERLVEALASGRIRIPSKLVLIGFDELPPALERLAAACSRLGCAVQVMPPPTAPVGTLLRVAAADAVDEVRQAARWARRLIEAGETRIGIIAPDLASYQPLLERIFQEEIEPHSLLDLGHEDSSFNLTLGAPLARLGPVTAALEILAVGPRLDIDAVSFLLRTPYLAGAETESDSRSLFELNLRALRTDAFSLRTLERLAVDHPNRAGYRRINKLANIFSCLASDMQQRQRLLPGEWAGRFNALLQQVGWPGERPLDSHDFQVVKAWQEKLLKQFCTLDAVCRPLSRSEAVALLRRLAGEEVFQPQSPDSSLQVCGVLEAGGLAFDHLWVLGLHEDAWPAPARPNPFLPVPLQSRYGMPHADPGREALFARRVMARLRASASTVVLSHPRQQGDCPVRPSPFIASMPAAEVPLAPTHAPQHLISNFLVISESPVDACGPELADGELTLGGTAILKDQALCPFRAFAHHRLGVAALEKPSPGIDPSTRGSLIHQVLENFWLRTRSHYDLCAMSEEACRQRIQQCVAEAIDSVVTARGQQLPQALLNIERDRLQRLSEEWLQVERERPSFICLECEKMHEEHFGGLSFRTKIDRIDQISDGSLVVIDYKTGRIDIDDLLAERLLEPQLPIYGAGIGDGDLAAVAFAHLRRGQCAIKGVARDDGILPETAAFAASKLAAKHGFADWDELLCRWRQRLEALGREFSSGLATVEPVDDQKACRTCDLATLCRIADAVDPIAGGGEEP